MIIFGIVGLLIITYALWVKNEKVQDALFIIGGACLLVYSIYINDTIFVVLQIIFMLSAFLELLKLRRK